VFKAKDIGVRQGSIFFFMGEESMAGEFDHFGWRM